MGKDEEVSAAVERSVFFFEAVVTSSLSYVRRVLFLSLSTGRKGPRESFELYLLSRTGGGGASAALGARVARRGRVALLGLLPPIHFHQSSILRRSPEREERRVGTLMGKDEEVAAAVERVVFFVEAAVTSSLSYVRRVLFRSEEHTSELQSP